MLFSAVYRGSLHAFSSHHMPFRQHFSRSAADSFSYISPRRFAFTLLTPFSPMFSFELFIEFRH
jgi:hypothetical protein